MFLGGFGVEPDCVSIVPSKRVYVEELLANESDTVICEIASELIGEKIMEYLHDLDDVAYVRFASVYRSFKDLKEFMAELQEMVRRDDRGKKKRKGR